MKVCVYLTVVLLATSTFSCSDASTDPDQAGSTTVYLEREYVNWAWGYAHNGWFLDPAGNIISYDIAKSGTAWVPSASGYYTEEELEAKMHHRDTLRGVVPLDTVKLLDRLALASLGGTYSDTVCPGADMGALIYSCYVYRADSSKFRHVVLRVDGDCRYQNTSDAARELSDWMSHRHF